MRNIAIAALAAAMLTMPAFAEGDIFTDGKDGAKIHAASGFICPQKLGRFERNAVGVRDPATAKDYCAYSARDGVYGIIVLSPLSGSIDAKALLEPEFLFQEGARARLSEETELKLGADKALPVYARIYDAAKVEAVRYRVLLASGAVGKWAVSVSVEYGEPRDKEIRDDFLNAVYDTALKELAAKPASQPAP